jgi:hypothetical protein
MRLQALIQQEALMVDLIKLALLVPAFFLWIWLARTGALAWARLLSRLDLDLTKSQAAAAVWTTVIVMFLIGLRITWLVYAHACRAMDGWESRRRRAEQLQELERDLRIKVLEQQLTDPGEPNKKPDQPTGRYDS